MRVPFKRTLMIASIAFLPVSPLLAAGQIENARPGNVAEWVRQVNSKLDQSMPVDDNPVGMVVVTFRRGADGYPVAVQVHDASPLLHRAARKTLRRVRQLPQLPPGVNPHQLITLRLLFAGDEDLDTYSAKRRAMTNYADQANHRLDVKLASAGATGASAR